VDIADAALVYAGQGWVLPKKNINPYAAVNVKGKLLVVSQQPGQRFPGGPDYANAVSPQQYAASQGAAGIVLLADTADRYARLRTDAATPQSGFSPAPMSSSPTGSRPAPLPVIVLSPRTSQQLLPGRG
jgi:hypothetical protein